MEMIERRDMFGAEGGGRKGEGGRGGGDATKEEIMNTSARLNLPALDRKNMRNTTVIKAIQVKGHSSASRIGPRFGTIPSPRRHEARNKDMLIWKGQKKNEHWYSPSESQAYFPRGQLP